MANPFRFKLFTIVQQKSAMKVTTDSCLFGAWAGEKLQLQNFKVKNVLDIGSGTGLLSLMIAQKIDAYFDTIEIDLQAAEEANENCLASPWKNKINVVNADAKTFEFSSKYDVIVSNPPFHEQSLKSGDARKDSARHDDTLSLKDLIGLIARNLQPEGLFYLLLPVQRLAELELLIQQNKLQLTRVTAVRQNTKSSYFRIMISGKFFSEPATYQSDELAIKGADDEYTKEFINLLRDYYLYLDV